MKTTFKWILILLFLGVISASCVYLSYYSLLFLLFLIVISLLTIQFKKGIYLLILLVPISIEAIAFDIRADWNFSEKLISKDLDLVSLALPFIFIIFGSFMLNRWAKIEKTTQKNPLRGIQWIFFAYALLTLFWCPNKGHGLFQLMVLLANFMLYTIVLYSITDEKTHRNIMWWWVIWGTIQSLAVYSFYFFHSLDLFYIGKVVEGINLSIFVPTGHYMGSRVIRRGEAFATPLETVLIMNLVFSIALGLFLTESRKWKRYLLIGIMIQIISIVLLTMSRAGLFSFFVMGFTMFLLIRRLRERFVAGFSLFLLILVTVFVIQHSLLNLLFKYTFIPPRIGLGYVTKSTGTMMPAFAGQRVRFWKWGYNILQESSFLGGGIGSYKYFTRAPHAHSLYLSFLFDFGWVGFILILSIMIVLLRRFLKWIKFQSSYLQCLAASFFGGMIAMGVHGAVDFEYNRPIPWLYIGMATATLNLLEREEQA